MEALESFECHLRIAEDDSANAAEAVDTDL
jgi:hypothetical protein